MRPLAWRRGVLQLAERAETSCRSATTRPRGIAISTRAASACPPRPSGNTRRAAENRTRIAITRGATIPIRPKPTCRNRTTRFAPARCRGRHRSGFSTENSTARPTSAGRERRKHIKPPTASTASASTTWPAMSGNGAMTGTRTIITPTAPPTTPSVPPKAVCCRTVSRITPCAAAVGTTATTCVPAFPITSRRIIVGRKIQIIPTTLSAFRVVCPVNAESRPTIKPTPVQPDGRRNGGRPPRDANRPPRPDAQPTSRNDSGGTGGSSRGQNGSFVLRSSEVTDGGTLPVEFTGDGASATLPLEWSGAPAGTKSYALIMHHIDPQGVVKWYWTLYNIPADVLSLPKNVKSVGTLGNNSVNRSREYAPPHSKGPGPKTYIYTVYALSAPPQLTVPPSRSQPRSPARGHEGQDPCQRGVTRGLFASWTAGQESGCWPARNPQMVRIRVSIRRAIHDPMLSQARTSTPERTDLNMKTHSQPISRLVREFCSLCCSPAV